MDPAYYHTCDSAISIASSFYLIGMILLGCSAAAFCQETFGYTGHGVGSSQLALGWFAMLDQNEYSGHIS